MKIPELSKTHRIAIGLLIFIIVILMLVYSTPTGNDLSSHDEKSIKKKDASLEKDKQELEYSQDQHIPPTPDGVINRAKPCRDTLAVPGRKKEPKKEKAINNPEIVSMKELFAPYRETAKRRVPARAEKSIPVKQFAEMIIHEIVSFSADDFKVIEKALLNADNLNIATIGLQFIHSDSEKLQILGFELITKASISGDFFKPNDFFMAFAEKGFAVEPFISEIIENTDDDFCREWACELYVDIFFHNTDNSDGRHQQLAKIKIKEKGIYKKLKEVFSNPKEVEKLIETKQKIGDQIRRGWGKENRYTMKLLAVMKLLDNLNKKNQYPTTQKILKIIRTYNFNYDILNRIDGKPVERPLLPDLIKLKYLSNAVFKEQESNTFKWLQKKDGGFTADDLKRAVTSSDVGQIKYMNKVFHKIICNVLRGKLLLGLGNNELELLRYFHFASWNKKAFDWENNMITVRNMKGEGAPLLLLQKTDIEKILTGKGVTAGNAEEKKVPFYIPSQSVFVWFAKDGDYVLSVNKKNTALKPEKLLNFEDKKFAINKNNITFDIF